MWTSRHGCMNWQIGEILFSQPSPPFRQVVARLYDGGILSREKETFRGIGHGAVGDGMEAISRLAFGPE